MNYDAQDAHDTRPVPALVASGVPELVATAGERASIRCLEFFAANIHRLEHDDAAMSHVVVRGRMI
jgi:hypothetical protein